MSKSYKRLLKEAQSAMVAKVAKPGAESARGDGGAGVAAIPGTLKIELVNAAIIFSQTKPPYHVTSPDAQFSTQIDAPAAGTQEPPAAAPSPFEATEVASGGVDTPLAPKPLESQGTAAGGGPGAETVPMEAESIQAPKAEDSKGVQARVYAKPLNPRMRLIEFITGPRKGEHGQLWIKDTTQIMLNWRVWVVPDVNRPTPAGLHWVLDGQYNWRGIRVK